MNGQLFIKIFIFVRNYQDNHKKIPMKDRLWIGWLAGMIAPSIVILLFWSLRFNDLSIGEWIQQAIVLKVHSKIISIGVFFADLGLFFLFLRLNKYNASKGVILAVFIYFFLFLFL